MPRKWALILQEEDLQSLKILQKKKNKEQQLKIMVKI